MIFGPPDGKTPQGDFLREIPLSGVQQKKSFLKILARPKNRRNFFRAEVTGGGVSNAEFDADFDFNGAGGSNGIENLAIPYRQLSTPQIFDDDDD